MAGNATMTHLVLGIDPEPLGVAPFIMATRLYPEVLAADLGLGGIVHPRARAVVFPALGAYVGGDITAGLLASGMDRDKRVRLFIDIGTNCEIVLGNRDWLLATAAPAGPAFEGAAIRCGMRAADGAIEVVTLTPDELTLKVIGDAEPQGLCGSGLVDAVTDLVKVGLLDSSGRFIAEEAAAGLAPGLAGRLTTIGKERVFVLHWRAARERPRREHLPVPARRARAAVRQGGHRHRLADPAGGGRAGSGRRPAGAAGRVVRQLPVPGQRDPDRPGPQGAGAADRLRRQRGRRGGEDGAAQPARAGRRPGAAGGGEVCRALRPRRLQRPLRRAAAVPPDALRSWPAGRWPGTCARSWPAAAGRPPCTPLPAVLHNRPQTIVTAAERAVASALASGRTVALAYADCGTYGALDELCARYGVRRLPGLHCYDVFAGADRIAAMFDAEPGTYVLTDFLLRSFDRSVLAELGLDRYPELWDDYFGHYTRLVWLAQEPSAALAAEADRVAGRFGLPLTRVDVGVSRLEQALEVRCL